MADLDRLLREKGITEDQLSRLSRWDKVKLLREIINNEKEKGVDNEETRRYARDLQSKAKAQKENYKKIYEETFKTNYMFISSSNTSLESNENVEFSLEMARDLESDSDDSNDDDENDSTTENEQTNKETNDPKELVKNGVCTSHFNVDWNELGFGNYPQRKVLKIINISYNDKKLNVSVEWERQPHILQKFEKLDSFVNNRINIARDDLDTYVLKAQMKSLKNLQRRIRSQHKNGGVVDKFLLFEHSAMLVQNPNGTLNFILDPEIIRKIESSSRAFDKFNKSNRPPEKRSEEKTKQKKKAKPTRTADK
ncbi:hypothetical protein TVAG_407770 [Trichomonas vaginalis G3]|uniref:Uncharacterized protein n=1 Tax=Trichomonas vaginalis (strain ATCC PRA-98 / G3) TaxID=412133 RepID=A2FNC9_TRIV3|nr:negative regulation of protein autoubiquitination [Trichomonas vaginalis G3]EAX93592.1 hypothetical protein TVAG_407770 [Trichomonas vaginalis G3]KAI5541221.1 negative regulation of protein autoubiquitination [Trichomonas vaginalis G3]|eukprot:XP_001306522.1 hypothetical protein [Trichomonas vaginalis G3]